MQKYENQQHITVTTNALFLQFVCEVLARAKTNVGFALLGGVST
jgi:hypothetical protein